MQITSPFAELTEGMVNFLARRDRKAQELERKHAERVDAYRELLNDPRYTSLKQGILADVGTDLALLVAEAAKIPELAGKAERITLYSKIISEPLKEIWLAENAVNMASNDVV